MPRLPTGAGRQGSTSSRGRGACECLQPPAATSPTGTLPHQRPPPSALSPGVLSPPMLFPVRPPQAHLPCADRGSPPPEHSTSSSLRARGLLCAASRRHLEQVRGAMAILLLFS
jgi:hypothetical protein